MINFDFLRNLKLQPIQLDLSHNQEFGLKFHKYLNELANITFLKFSNVNISLFSSFSNFEHLDLSYNNFSEFF